MNGHAATCRRHRHVRRQPGIVNERMVGEEERTGRSGEGRFRSAHGGCVPHLGPDTGGVLDLSVLLQAGRFRLVEGEQEPAGHAVLYGQAGVREQAGHEVTVEAQAPLVEVQDRRWAGRVGFGN